MYFSTAFVLAAAGFAAAQTSSIAALNPAATATGQSCNNALEAIVNECLKTEMPKVTACAANDWSCLCAAQQQVITCFNNCPADTRAFGEQQTEVQWCAAAKTYPSTSSSVHYAQPTPTKLAAAPAVSSRPKSGGSPKSSGGSDAGDSSAARAIGAPVAGAVVMLVGAIALL